MERGVLEPAAPADDFPFYADRPVALTAAKWGLVLLGAVLGFVALTAPVPLFATPWGQWIPAILFPLIPLLVLSRVTAGHASALFRRVGWRDIGWMVGIALLNIVVSVSVALPISRLFGADANPAMEMLRGQETGERVMFFLKTLPQLLGEEVMTVLPFLAIAWWLHRRCGMRRTPAIVLAWLGSAVIFGMAHLPTYHWNWVQCLVIIGSARLVLFLGYLKTRNLWVSAGAHILNDWLLFGAMLVLSGMTSTQAG